MNKYVFFWNGIYSQWHPAQFEIGGVYYNCCEQYMMHQKALTFGDFGTAELIMKTNDPSEQKKLGRQVAGFNKDVWDKVCIGIVYEGNLAKFSQNPNLKTQLLATGDKVIVEASPYDVVWGIGMGVEQSGIDNPAQWRGLNLLGWSIMLVRNTLRD